MKIILATPRAHDIR